MNTPTEMAARLSDVIGAAIAGFPELQRHVSLAVYTPIEHDPAGNHFGKAVEYKDSGATERQEFRGTTFRNKDGVYFAVVEAGALHFQRMNRGALAIT